MFKTKHLLATFVVLEAAIIGLLLASRWQITFAPTTSPKAPTRKARRSSKKSLRTVPKTVPRISSN